MSVTALTSRSRARLLPRIGALALMAALGTTAVAAADGPNYQAASRFSPANLRPFLYDTSVTPNWIGKTDLFWYSYRTSNGTNYFRVNPKLGTREPLFDRDKLTMQLSALLQKPLEPGLLALTRPSINDEGTKFKFVIDDFQYEYDLTAETLAKLGKAPPAPIALRGPFGQRGDGVERRREDDQQQQQQQQNDQQQQQQQQNDQQQQQQRDGQTQGQGQGPRAGGRGAMDYRTFSPDHKVFVFAQKHNLYLAEEGKEDQAVAITTDGTEDYGFGGLGGFGRGGNGTGTGNSAATPPKPDAKTRVNAVWSKDSKAFYVTRFDSRGVKELYVIDSLAQPRPTLEKYRYPMPGEEETRRSELYVYVRASKKLTKLPTKWKDETYTNLHWGKNPEELRFLRRDRLIRHAELCALNINNGEGKCLISEGFEGANLATQQVRYLDDTDEMLWWSERTGWGHYYLYDRDGKLKNAVTAGPYRASAIVEVDAKNRLLYFNGNGRESGENVYNQHLYGVHLDGTGLTLLDPGNANHRSSLSPSRQFVVDNYSRVDLAPVTVVRHGDGREIMTLEKADLSRLVEAGWKLPATFSVKAADGVTDLYGNLWKPFDFDAKRKYPIIVHVYPGPQQEGTIHNFSPSAGEQQLAQLGFIVIQVGHRGGTPTRSKAYHSFGYYNLRDYGLADKKAAIEQLAARFSYIDIDKVGIYGHSGGGFMTAAALLQKPYNEFFKVGVSTSGNHDNNIYNSGWAETYHGLREVVINESKDKDKSGDKTQGTGAAQTQGRAAEGQSVDGGQGADDIVEDVEEEIPLREILGGIDGPSDDKKDDAKKAEGAKADDTKKADDAKKVESKKVDDTKKADVKKVDDTKKADDAKKADVKKADDAKKAEATPPKTRFEIHVPTNAELAGNLKGRLLLVHGELDNNVHPANTLRLVDALIKANKRFDMLYLPGKRHAYADYQPYVNQRMMEYFAENLLGDYQRGADIDEKATTSGHR
jgi:dipeptidyl-peptidase 4